MLDFPEANLPQPLTSLEGKLDSLNPASPFSFRAAKRSSRSFWSRSGTNFGRKVCDATGARGNPDGLGNDVF